jgi:threonylcarbamoyladenosine tRNA methylthiotransferase MtaB
MGCPENRFDVGQLQGQLEAMGVEITRDLRKADTIILNTCGLTEGMENICVEMLRKLQDEAPKDARIVVSGCLPIIHGEVLEEFSNVHIVRGPLIDSFQWDTDPGLDRASIYNPQIFPQRVLYDDRKAYRFDKGVLWNIDRLLYKQIGICPPKTNRCFIKIASGCDRLCTFCAVRISRGPLQSRPMEWVVDRFQRGLDAGYQDFSIIGTNVSAWGKDIGSSLPRLLERLLEFDAPFKLYLRNLEPEDIIHYLPEFLEILKSGKVPYMEFPLESGSDRILKLMNRAYKVEEYVTTVKEIKRVAPKILLRSQVMVGFPTETDKDFEDTVRYACELPFVFVEPFLYSPRPGTAAARMEGQIPHKIARRRFKELHRRLMRAHLGYKLKVLSGCYARNLFSKKKAV